MNVRTQAQDAASWYISHLDVYTPNHENVQRYLRGPLIALTVNNILPAVSPYPHNNVASMPAAQEVEEEKKSGSSDWRDFLSLPVAAGSQSNADSISAADASEKAKEAFQNLSRRTKVRMEAFLAGCALAVPIEGGAASSQDRQHSDLVSLQEGLSGFGISSSPLQRVPGKPRASLIRNISTRANSIQRHPQIQERDLVLRLELYIRTLQRVKNINEECVIAMEPPKTIKVRALITTDAFVATAGTIRNLRHVLTRLLNCLTMETLAVEVLSEDITVVIRRIVSEYEHGTSFASLAFLSTPEVNADSLLTPLIMKYLRYLQSNWEKLISACELERMLARALDPEMRKLFKTIEFRSIGHLLEVCHEQRSRLLNIELAPNVCAVAENVNSLIHSKEALRQALRDLQREVITVNGHVLPPVHSRKELLKVLKQTLNSRTLTAAERIGRKGKQESPRRHGGAASKVVALGQKNPVLQSGNSTPKAIRSKENLVNTPSTPKSTTAEDSDYLFSSEAESGMSDAHDDSSAAEAPTPTPSGSRRVRRRNFHLSTIDLLTRRLLIAASRTGNGGDAYFVVRDLFGGEDVEVVPTSTSPLESRMVRPGTIDILVRLASVTIKCHQSFDIYPKALVRECEPLVQFHTTTTETITLQEVRSDKDEYSNELSLKTLDRIVTGAVDGTVMVLQEQHTSTTGWRTISVRPAVYEKVEDWGTPS